MVLQLGLASAMYSVVLPFYLVEQSATALGVLHAVLMMSSVALYCWTAVVDTTDPQLRRMEATGPLYCASCQVSCSSQQHLRSQVVALQWT